MRNILYWHIRFDLHRGRNTAKQIGARWRRDVPAIGDGIFGEPFLFVDLFSHLNVVQISRSLPNNINIVYTVFKTHIDYWISLEHTKKGLMIKVQQKNEPTNQLTNPLNSRFV